MIRGERPLYHNIILSHNIYYEQDAVVIVPSITARYEAVLLFEMISMNSDRFVGTPIDGDASEPSSSPAPMIDQLEPDCDASIVTLVVPVTPEKLNVTRSDVHVTDDNVAADAEDAPSAITAAAANRLIFFMILSF